VPVRITQCTIKECIERRSAICLSAANSNSITVDGLPVSVSKIELRQSQ
jgi:hypothetical protein